MEKKQRIKEDFATYTGERVRQRETQKNSDREGENKRVRKKKRLA